MKSLKYLFTIALIACLFVGCKYDFILEEEEVVIDPDTDEISFSADILPIFTSSDNCTSCHDTGGQIPDLTAANAYSSINNSRYINSTTPEESKIYTIPNPETSTHSHKKYTTNQAALVLAWIEQGAENN